MKTEECSQCSTHVDEGTHICPNCGNFLPWDDKEGGDPVDPETYVRPDQPYMPPDPEPQPNVQPVVSAPPPPSPFVPSRSVAPTITCTVCSEVNPADREWCQRCGTALKLTIPGPDNGGAHDWNTWWRRNKRLVTIIVGGVVALAAIGFVAWQQIRDESPPTTLTTTEETTIAATTVPPQPAPATGVSVVASSEDGVVGRNTYWASNTLDGREDTAWNHCNSEGENGSCESGAGSTLTYTFAEPVQLLRIEIKNGYWKTDGKEDRFAQNSRVANATLTTDAGGSFQVSFENQRVLKTVEEDFGVVNSVTLSIETVYDGDPWNDLAISEISFIVLPAATSVTTTAP